MTLLTLLNNLMFGSAGGIGGSSKATGPGVGYLNRSTGAVGEIRSESDGSPPFAPQLVIHILMDDAGRQQFGAYGDKNSWPDGYAYPATPWLDSKIADGIRYTKARVTPRCSPHRACEMSGRHAHVSPGHPYGTQVGEVNQPEYFDPDYPWLGLQAKHRPFPEVARTSGSLFVTGLFAKYHLYHYSINDANQVSTENPLAPGEIAGYDMTERSDLSGNGGPSQGYYGYKWETIVRDPITGITTMPANGEDLGQDDPGKVFNETHIFNRMVDWIRTQLDPAFGGTTGQKVFVNWWTHLPHGTQPAIEPNHGPLADLIASNAAGVGVGAPTALYTGDFGLAAAIGDLTPSGTAGDNARSTDGKTFAGGHLADGTVDGGGEYGPYGQANVLWRRQYTMIKVFDTLCQRLEDWLTNAYPEVAKNTLWVIDSDNGIATTDFDPTLDSAHEAGGLLGGLIDGNAVTSLVQPPTMDGTVTGEQYHVSDHAKGSCRDEGILTPMVVWGDMLPERVRGVDCPALIESVDLYPTFLDILAPPVAPGDETGRQHWKDAIGEKDLSKVDGVSFMDTFFDITAGRRQYAFSQVFGPAAAPIGAETWIQRCVVNRVGWKLYRNYNLESGPSSGDPVDEWLLFDLSVDPREKDETLYALAVADPTSEAGVQLADLQAEYDRRIA